MRLNGQNRMTGQLFFETGDIFVKPAFSGLSPHGPFGRFDYRTVYKKQVRQPNNGRPKRQVEVKESPAMSLRFVASQLHSPSTALVAGERGAPDTVFIRFMENDGTRLAYLPDDGAEAIQYIHRIRAQGAKFSRVIVVGADSLFEPGNESLMGRDEALSSFCEMLKKLAHERVPFLWRTRAGISGLMPTVLAEALTEASSLASVEIGLACLDPNLNNTLEGRNGTKPDERLRLAAAVSARGVAVRGLIDPLVPVLTDQSSSLSAICQAFADAGVHKVSVRYLVLTRARAKMLTKRLSRMMRDMVKGCFAGESWRKPEPMAITHAKNEAHKLLPASLRRKGHDRVFEIASSLGLAVDILDPVEETPVTHEKSMRKKERKEPVHKPQLDLFTRKTG